MLSLESPSPALQKEIRNMKVYFSFIIIHWHFSAQAFSFEACEGDSTPSHTQNGHEECDFQYT